MEIEIGKSRLVLVCGDITQQDVEAIVNAANSSLLGGGGVDGAIHRAGGPAILQECKQIVAAQGGCATGDAVITTGGRLRAKFVIHTVGPVWSGGKRGEEGLLASAYRSSLRIAAERSISSLAFPSISTGAYRFPIARAADIALHTVREFLRRENHAIVEMRFVLFSDSDLAVYEAALARLKPS
ncbi:MAG TPA: O-acetyl-ADP-ribose deacetylase [Candidatus Binatia bacterium]|nr:O-acetyl-ADP-ribose deacetylase [Candidatus Binatia bacterium]